MKTIIAITKDIHAERDNKQVGSFLSDHNTDTTGISMPSLIHLFTNPLTNKPLNN